MVISIVCWAAAPWTRPKIAAAAKSERMIAMRPPCSVDLKLLRLDIRLLCDIPENDHLLAHELAELVGLHRHGRDADPADLLAHFLPLEDGVHLGVQLLVRGGRRSGAR